MMYGQMTAGSWIYIGSQGIVQGTYETFVEMGRRHYGGDLKGKWILTAGLGGMGGAQPLAASMAGASLLAVECRPSSIEFRLRTGYVDVQAKDLDDALAIIERSTKERKAVSVALLGNAGEVLPELLRRGVRPDIVTDQTSAHDPINGYLPKGWSLAAMGGAPHERSEGSRTCRQSVDGRTRAGDARLCPRGRPDRRLRQQHSPDGARRRRQGRLRLPWLRAGLHPPAVLPRRRAVPLGCAVGRSRGHFQDRRQGQRAHAGQPASAQLARHGACADQVPGPAGAHLLGRPRRPASARPRLQRNGRVRANSRRRSSSAAIISIPARSPPPTAKPNRCRTAPTQSPTGRSSTRYSIAPQARPGCRSITAAASAWASRSTPAWSSSATARPEAARRIERVLWNDPASGVMRHADAGYETAIACAKEKGLDLPSLGDR